MSADFARWQLELSELRGISQGFSAQLIAAADDLRDEGRMVPIELLSQLEEYSTRFHALQAAMQRELPMPPHVASLDELEQALQGQQQVQQALQVVEAAARLKHREHTAFAPLNRVLELCQSLRQQLTTTPGAVETADELIDGRHAVAALVRLVRESDSLSDERWQLLQELVANQFGRELATAVARGRVTESVA